MKMKKLLGLLLMGTAMFSSCGNDHEDLYDPNAVALMKANEYAKAFVQQFGNINPNQDWGFGNPLSRLSVSKEKHDWKAAGVKVPNDITNEEKELVEKWFAEHKNPTSVSIDFSNFWLQHVSNVSTVSIMHYNADDTFKKESTENFYLDKMSVGNKEVVPDYNHTYGTTMLVKDASTSDFGYHNPFSQCFSYQYTDKTLYTVQCINGSYYVGFDLYGYKKEGDGSYQVQGEKTAGFYNDWIVKLTPMRKYRVIAEDLGSIGDFDFNDVVFDVACFAKQSDESAMVVLQAAGGTLPLYIGCGGTEYEVHDLFGVETDVMVNTGAGVTKEPVTIKFEGCQDINEIYIKVVDGDSNYIINAGKGEAPQKICVSTDFVWTNERVNLKTAYPDFMKYVKDELADDTWY